MFTVVFRRGFLALCLALGITVAVPAVSQAAPAWPVVDSGDSGAGVRGVQYLLQARGQSLTVDGSFGPTTKARTIAFQQAKGLTADGVVGAKTWGALVATREQGANDSYVRAAQTLLNKYGYGLTVDGAFGVNTTSAVKSFQKAKGLVDDGVVGPITWQYLAGSSGSTNPVETSCTAVTGPVPQSHTTVVSANGYSFRVHTCLATKLSSLLRDARAAGYTLGGWGYRSYDSQVALRKKHCGTSYYAIYQMPSSQCTPPTAIPGRSLHERGLALDFNSAGGTLSAGAFTWLKNNAARYGLKNLPSERWHWSTTGG